MAIFENLPFTNLHDLNLDWIIKKLKQLEDQINDPTEHAPVLITPTAKTGVCDISAPGITSTVYKIGHLVVVNMEIEITSDSDTWSDSRVLTGLPLPIGATNKELSYLSIPAHVDNGTVVYASFSATNSDEEWALCISDTLSEYDLVTLNFVYLTGE